MRLPLSLLAVLAAVGVFAAPAQAVTYAPLDAPGPALTVPAAQLEASLKCVGDLAGAAREPVLLLPATGVNSQQNFGYNYERAFAANGTPYCTSDQPGDANTNLTDIQTRGEYVTYAIRTMYARAGRRIATLGHSQGGMVMRWSLRFWPDTRGMVDDVIGMAGSNHGTTASMGCTGGCAAANAQQGADSQFSAALNSGAETFSGVSYTEVYTHNDEVVMPNMDAATGSSSLRTGAGRIANVALQDICPADTSEHLMIGTSDAVAYALVDDALAHDGPAVPARIDPTVCTQPYQPGINAATYATDSAAAAAALGTNEAMAPMVAAEPPLRCYVTATCTPVAPAPPAAAATPPATPTTAKSPPAAAKATACASRRTFTVHLSRRTAALRGLRVTLDGRRLTLTRMAGRASARVRLTGAKRSTATLRITGRTAAGKTVRQTRRYRTCVKRR